MSKKGLTTHNTPVVHVKNVDFSCFWKFKPIGNYWLIVNSHTVTLTVTVNNSKIATCTATVTVQDNVAPTALCKSVTVQLNASGKGAFTLCGQRPTGSNNRPNGSWWTGDDAPQDATANGPIATFFMALATRICCR